MYIVHIKITLHIQVPVYCKNVPTHVIMGLPKIYIFVSWLIVWSAKKSNWPLHGEIVKSSS